MLLKDFIEELFSQPAVEGYMLGEVEIEVSVSEGFSKGERFSDLVFCGGKITIVPCDLPDKPRERP
jgi:hypothetical protein